jgi:protein-tyrosine sulfotransferase
MPLPLFVRKAAARARRITRGAARRIAEPFTVGPPNVEVSAEGLSVARAIRGKYPPTIMVHGVMQRSGTRYLGELMKLHPDVCVYPRGFIELPFLNQAEAIRIIQARFLGAFAPNREGIGADDFLPLFGASFIAYVYGAVPDGRTALLAMPDVSSLAYFPFLLPYERPLLLMRDGRDVAESMVRSWPDFPFDEACIRWNRAARIMLMQQKLHANDGWKIFRYEDAVNNTRRFIEEVCEYCDLDAARYPYDRLGEVPVVGSSEFKPEGRVTWEPIAKPSDFKPIGRWQSWTEKQTRTFKRIAGRTLIEAGYAANSSW